MPGKNEFMDRLDFGHVWLKYSTEMKVEKLPFEWKFANPITQ